MIVSLEVLEKLREPRLAMKDFNHKLTRPLQIRKRVEKNKGDKGGTSKVWLLFSAIVIIGYFAYTSYGPTSGHGIKVSDHVTIIKQGSNISRALVSFAGEHDGQYPCEATGPAATVEQCFQQLIDGGHVEDETIFWSKSGARAGIVSKAQPDNDGILEPGECAWGYVKGLTTSSSTRTPIVFDSSVKPGLFNTVVWDESAIIVRLVGSVKAAPIASEKDANEGVILEDKDGRKVDIFANLPEGSEIMVPSKF